jgi:hypothetical protein
MTGSFDAGTGILSLTGTDTPGHYTTALRAVEYWNAAPNAVAGTRDIEFKAGAGHSSTCHLTLSRFSH